jgi:2-polyprenyl-3-methyl-5-hydroxy-6-metoxy-1,4-benzoquinol methylase
VESQYAKEYRNLYEHHWWWRAREDAIVALLRGLRLAPGISILDVGCGDALFFDRLAEFGNVEGLEPDARLIEPANPHSIKINTVPFDKNFQPGKRYGLILMLDVLEHLDRPEEAVSCVYDLLDAGGVFLLTVPAFPIPLLRKARFSIEKARYWYQWTFPVKLVEGIAQKITHSGSSPPRVPPNWLNRFLYRLSRLEQQATGEIGAPFGSTLMVLCVKHPDLRSGK